MTHTLLLGVQKKLTQENCFSLVISMVCLTPGGHSVTKHTGDWLEDVSPKPQNIYTKIALKNAKSFPLNLLKVQSERSKISNLGQILIFTENCTTNYPYESF